MRVLAGRAETRGLPLHLARFRRTALEVAAENNVVNHSDFASTLEAFLDAATATIAATGEGFPRLELWADPGEDTDTANVNADSAANRFLRLRFSLALRPLPALGAEIDLRTAPHGAILPHPERKGPGIAAHADLRRALGAEPLLLDDQGFAIEGGTTSLLWWAGDEARVAGSTARVDSVTEHLVREALIGAGVPVSAASATPTELATTEVWALNALHGIRPVRAIDGNPLAAPYAPRLARAHAALEMHWAPIL